MCVVYDYSMHDITNVVILFQYPGIRVSLRGEARTQWREKLPPVAFRSRRGALVRSVDPFLCHRMTVWGKGNVSNVNIGYQFLVH